jgi:hypothetical protein
MNISCVNSVGGPLKILRGYWNCYFREPQLATTGPMLSFVPDSVFEFEGVGIE